MAACSKQLEHLSNTCFFYQHGGVPPDSNKNSKIVKTNRQNVYEVHECNYEGLHAFFYKHGVFQSEARICLSFSQIEPQNMLKVCLT